MEHKFSKVARFWYQYFRFVYIFLENLKEIAKFDFFCKFKVKMARRSKRVKDLKSNLKFRQSNHKRFSDLVVSNTESGKEVQYKWWCFKQSN